MRTLAGAVVALGLVILGSVAPAHADEIPYFARKYGLACSACHVQPPKLNEYGESFRQRGYSLPGLEPRGTVPLAIWASARSDAFSDEPQVRDAVRAYINKLEVISGGRVIAPWLSYFAEWRPVSFETQRRDGEVGLRDRSGRFEDLFLTASAGNVALTIGQFRQIDQVDVSLRLGLSEPLSLGAGLAGSGGGTARQQSLRGFAPAGRSPSARIAWTQPLASGWAWTTSAALPVPGEFSIPLTREARVEASNEIEWRPKGIVLESFLRRGLMSFGGHAFYDDDERYLVQAVGTGHRERFFLTGVGGIEKQGDLVRGRWSLESEFAPVDFAAIGARLEDRAADGAATAFLPYVRAHFPGTRFTFYLSIEQRLQQRANATLFELGTVF